MTKCCVDCSYDSKNEHVSGTVQPPNLGLVTVLMPHDVAGLIADVVSVLA
jgi:hypothetical protein